MLALLRLQWDRATALLLVALGAGAMVLGWLGASATPYPAAQIPYVISGAIAGIFLLGLGATLWLSADLRDEWRKLDRIEQRLAEQQASTVAAVEAGGGTAAENGSSTKQLGGATATLQAR